jgi:hypothetical protein
MEANMRSREDFEPVAVDGEVIKETTLAVLFRHTGGECWLPKSQIESWDHFGAVIPMWLARKEDLV